MWKRKELKANAKAAFKSNYWASVLAAVILVTIALGGAAGITVSLVPSMGSLSLASKATPAFATEEANDESTDTDEIPELRIEDFEGIKDIEGINLTQLLNSDNESLGAVLNETLNTPALFVILGIAIAILTIVALIALLIKILIFNPIQVACYQFFKENAIEKTSGLKFDFNNKYKNIVLGMFLRGLFILLWSMLFLIPGIIKSYSYRMVPFILTDNPEITATEAITLSRQMMKGNKWRAFVLDLSFIGWYILSALTLGALSIFYVNPYVYATEAELYHTIKPKVQ